MVNEAPFHPADALIPGDGQFEEQVSQALAAILQALRGERLADLPAVAQLVRGIVGFGNQAHAQEIHLDTDVSVGLTQVFFRVDGELLSFAWLPTQLRDPVIDHLLGLAGLSSNAWPLPEKAALALGDAFPWHLTVVPTDEGMRDAILRRTST
jgi:type II secretory ATPase GspE/PulE/Tfp pilus assembly ATPase PilB-like protein